MSIKIAIVGLITAMIIVGLSFYNSSRHLGLIGKSINQTNQAVSQNQFQNPQLIPGDPLQFATSSNSNSFSSLSGAEKNAKKINQSGINNDSEALAPNNSSTDNFFNAPSITTSSSMLYSQIFPSQISSQAISQKTPNNIDLIIAEIKKNSVKQGKSQEDIAKMENAIRQVAATSTDLIAEFFRIAKIKNVSANSGGLKGFFGGFFEKILTDFGIIKIVEAGLGAPFGGRVVAAFPCTCTGGLVWELSFAPPLPPTYPVALSFDVGSQLYLSHVPGHPGQSFLGFYLPGVPACWMLVPDPDDPCFSLSDDGFISPQVGTSP